MIPRYQGQVDGHHIDRDGRKHENQPDPEAPVTMRVLPIGRGVPRDMFPIYRCLTLMNVLTLVHGLPFDCVPISEGLYAHVHSFGVAPLPIPDFRQILAMFVDVMFVLTRRLQLHEIDNINHTDFQIGQMFAKNGNGSQNLQRGCVATPGHHHLRLGALVVAGPLPDADSLRAMHDCRIHGQPMRERVLAYNHHVDVIPAAQAVIKNRQQAVSVIGRLPTSATIITTARKNRSAMALRLSWPFVVPQLPLDRIRRREASPLLLLSGRALPRRTAAWFCRSTRPRRCHTAGTKTVPFSTP